MSNSNQILHGDETRCEEKFYRSTTLPALAKLLVTRILTRDLFSVANLLVYCCFCKFDFAAVACFFSARC